MKKFSLFFFAFLVVFYQASGQQTSLAVGDQCPDFFIQKIMDYEKPTARRSDFKTPLLLLEFCTPACKACFNTVPLLDSLQKAFPGKLGVLLVTSRTAAELQKVKQYIAIRRNYALPYAVEDTALSHLFPA